MSLIQSAREWASLPKVTGQRIFDIEPAGVYAVNTVKRPPEGIFTFWNRHEVDVVGHQGYSGDRLRIPEKVMALNSESVPRIT